MLNVVQYDMMIEHINYVSVYIYIHVDVKFNIITMIS